MRVPHVRFDEEEDAVAALELVATVSMDLKERRSLWKWMVMGVQNALHAAMVLALAGTDGCGALRDKSQERNRKWLAKPEGPQPEVIMADYGTLLYGVQLPELMDGPPLEISGEDWQGLDRLNKLRRQFAHFNPQRWSIEFKLLLQRMPLALNAIEHLLTKQALVQARLTDEQKKRITSRSSLAKFEEKKHPRRWLGGHALPFGAILPT
jgi:hypothetical protein